MRYLILLFLISSAFAATTSIKDPTNDYQMKVNSDGSINTNGGGGSGGNVTVVSAIPGRSTYGVFLQSYPSSNLSTSAFTTIISSTTQAINEESIFDNSGGIYYLSYASGCGSLSSTANSVIIGPGGGGIDFQIAASSCVGFMAIGQTISTGSVYMTFLK
jgi:hypothetical protein